MTYQLRPADVRGLARHLSGKYGIPIVDKRSAPEMKVVRATLAAFQIPAADEFLKSYATTLVPPLLVTEPRIYLPFKPGAIGAGAPKLVDQVCVLGHEFHHGAKQYPADPAGFVFGYLNKVRRGKIEHEALEVDFEIYHAVTGRMLIPGQAALGLQAYGLTKAQCRTAEIHLRSVVIRIEHGGTLKDISQDVVAYLAGRRRSRRA